RWAEKTIRPVATNGHRADCLDIGGGRGSDSVGTEVAQPIAYVPACLYSYPNQFQFFSKKLDLRLNGIVVCAAILSRRLPHITGKIILGIPTTFFLEKRFQQLPEQAGRSEGYRGVTCPGHLVVVFVETDPQESGQGRVLFPLVVARFVQRPTGPPALLLCGV